MIVADASAVGTFLIPDEAGPFADFARSTCATQPLVVPAHWRVEVASLIRKALRGGRLTMTQTFEACLLADQFEPTIEVVPLPSVAAILTAATEHTLTAYDAAYFLLARDRGLPLLAQDGGLCRAAREHGIEVLAP